MSKNKRKEESESESESESSTNSESTTTSEKQEKKEETSSKIDFLPLILYLITFLSLAFTFGMVFYLKKFIKERKAAMELYKIMDSLKLKDEWQTDIYRMAQLKKSKANFYRIVLQTNNMDLMIINVAPTTFYLVWNNKIIRRIDSVKLVGVLSGSIYKKDPMLLSFFQFCYVCLFEKMPPFVISVRNGKKFFVNGVAIQNEELEANKILAHFILDGNNI